MKRKAFTLIELLVCIAIVALIGSVIIGGANGCSKKPDKKDADQVVAAQTKMAMAEATAQTGQPAIVNWQEKKMVKLIYELRDQENLVCYAYYFNQMEGKRGDFIGKCIGFGIPASVQYSNPERAVNLKTQTNGNRMTGDTTYGTMPQPEPNGLFMPDSLSATWLMLIDPATGDARPTYIEPLIIVSPFQLHST